MKIKASKSTLKGIVAVPGSKSHTIRSIVIGLLGEGTSTIINPLMSADTISCIEGAGTLGARVTISETDPKIITITGTGKNFKNTSDLIDVGNSGTSLSLLTSAAALFGKKIIFDGDDSIRSRPMLPLLLSLKDLGAQVSSKNNAGKCPFEVKGPILGGETTIDGITSQYLSSLLISCPLAEKTSIIKVKNLHEKPYVDITLFWLNKMGIKYKNEGLDYFEIPGNQKYPQFSEQIPSDFSTACFPLCAAAITKSDITIQGLDFSDPQGDKAIFEQMRKMGLKFEVNNKETIIKGSQSELKGITIDLNATPDALPVMSIVGCFAKGTTVLTNVP
ncbi:MAG: 3-phosphoshikimate 1-carboxyvinyltransferase, partial [uncultured bacterium]